MQISRKILLALSLSSFFCGQVVAESLEKPEKSKPTAADRSEFAEKFERQFNQWVFSIYGGRERTRQRQKEMAQCEIDLVDRMFSLNPGQKRKLEIGCRGDISRFFQQLDATRDQTISNFLATKDERQYRTSWRQWMAAIYGKQIGNGALFRKSLAHVLTSDQLAEYSKFRHDRRLFHLRALIANAMTFIEESVPLRDEQRSQLVDLIERETVAYRDPGQWRLSILLNRIEAISNLKLGFLDPLQHEAWRWRLRYHAEFFEWLGEEGLTELLKEHQDEEFTIQKVTLAPLPLWGPNLRVGNRKGVKEEVQAQVAGRIRREVYFIGLACDATLEQRQALLKISVKCFQESLALMSKPKTDWPGIAYVDVWVQSGTAGAEIPANTLPRSQEILIDASRKILTPTQFSRLEKALRTRREYHRRAKVELFVAAIDWNLLLSPQQREKMIAHLLANWNPTWECGILFLDDNFIRPPELPDQLLTEILTELQMSHWKKLGKIPFRSNIGYTMIDSPFELERR